MPETPSSHQMQIPRERSGRWRTASGDDAARDALARTIPRRAGVSWWLAIVLALGFAAIVTPAITAERWLVRFQPGTVVEKQPAPFTVRAPMLAGYDHLRVGGGVVVARGELVTHDEAAIADAIATAMPRGPVLYGALFALTFVLAVIFCHHMQRSRKGRLVRVQLVSLAVIAVLAVAVKLVMLATALSALVVPVAVLAMIPTMVLDRVVGIATGVLAALVVSLLAPFDVGLAILLLAQAATAGLVIAERPKRRWARALGAGLFTTLWTGAMYVLLTYLTTGRAPELHDPLHAAWLAALIGPAIAAFLAVPLLPLYQLLVGEITQGKLFALEDLSHPLLRRIAEQSPGTWQHSLMMANMAEIAANAIGANGRLVRVGAYFHDLGKSLSPKYFIENLEAGETSPHDQLPPEVSCDAIFAHVSEGIVAARKAGLHERIVDFMHMHHGNGVLEYFWAKCREQGNPHGYTIEQFRYPGHPPQSRETAILTICDAVEAASRTLKKPDAASIDSLVQRIVYGKLHLGQLDESGLSMGDLRRISDSLRETIRHANHGRIEYPWQKAEQDASASPSALPVTSTAPRLDSLDRKPGRDSGARPSTTPVRTPRPDSPESNDALATTADVTPPAAASGEGHGARVRAGTARNAHAGHASTGREADIVALPHAAEHDGAVAGGVSERDRGLGGGAARPASLVLDEAAERRRAVIDDAAASHGVVRDEASDVDTGRVAPRADRRAAPDARPAPAPVKAAPFRVYDRAGSVIEPTPGSARDAVAAAAREPQSAAVDAAAGSARDRTPSAAIDPTQVTARESAPAAARERTQGAASGPTPGSLRDTTQGFEPMADALREPAQSSARESVPGASRDTAQGFARDTAQGSAVEPATAPAFDARITATEPTAPALEAAARASETGPDLEPSSTLPGAAPLSPAGPGRVPGPAPSEMITPASFGDPAPAARKRAATLPPVPLRRPTTAPPPIVSRRVEPARTSGPPEPVDLENATTNPPPLRRGPGGQPPAPQDSAQIAAALAAIVSRVSSAPFGGATSDEPEHDPHAVDDNATTIPPPLARTPRATGAEDAITQPPSATSPGFAASAVRTVDSDSAATQPALAASPALLANAARVDSDSAVTQPVIAASPALLANAERASDDAERRAAADQAVTVPILPAYAMPVIIEPRSAASSAHPRPAASPGRRAVTENPAPTLRLPGPTAEDHARVTRPRATAGSRDDDDLRTTTPHRAAVAHDLEPQIEPSFEPRPDSKLDPALGAGLDGGVTEPSLPVLAIGDQRRVDVPLRAAPAARQAGWSSGLAARIDAAINDEWGHETPVVAPSRAELRALTGNPDPTRQQPIDEIQLLRRAAEIAEAESPRRTPHPTAEVDPDDIEAAIEVAPPARRPTNANAIGAVKPKKSE